MIPWNLPWMGEEDGLTYDEIHDNGTELWRLREGDWFACTGPVNSDGTGGMRMWTGQIITKCLGSILVQLDRSWGESVDRPWWAPETVVLRLPHPNEGKRISMTEFTDD